jgi:hypothetical protein
MLEYTDSGGYAKTPFHQDASGQVKQPHWVKCWGMWQEMEQGAL